LALGDKNTKFFHAYGSSRKMNNTIWVIAKEDGTVVTCSHEIEEEVVGFFSKYFQGRGESFYFQSTSCLEALPYNVQRGRR